ncbi:hypothetical protein EV361DRAFT_1023527 [Lentinula raphanica]|uniref:Uncharacterized protein n=1 Tax=Lentinula raphanica TaxID=153919 RepID=A0AA38PEH5_9AGAR|nr:hypothetical protein F5878DRAFT_708117 [Lentinula raphanica]KAJ3978074.1 hypothetical protein EV361DRAFT_1023527 [Lentinula raphanica]
MNTESSQRNNQDKKTVSPAAYRSLDKSARENMDWQEERVGKSEQVSTSQLEAALKKMSKQAAQYEFQMKELESQLSQNLSNFRAIDSLFKEASTGIKRNYKRADRALHSQIPAIEKSLEESSNTLTDLAHTLPKIRSQVRDIRVVYDTGREKAQSLVMDLTWLNTSFHERWRRTIFTPNAPVSVRWKAFMRFLFAISFFLCCMVVWVGLGGAYRAYRHKLVWGERLMS